MEEGKGGERVKVGGREGGSGGEKVKEGGRKEVNIKYTIIM